MAEIKDEIEAVMVLQVQEKALITEAGKRVEDANLLVGALKERVLAGETTGDEIKDFVLVRYGCFSDQIEGIYRGIQTHVKAHVGEFVFVFTAHDRHEGCTGFGGKGYYVRRNNLYLGVLKKDSILLNEPEKGCSFSTERFVSYENRKFKTIEKDLSEDSIMDGYWNKTNFGLRLKEEEKPLDFKTMLPVFERGEESPPEVVLRIGDEEVDGWFKERKFFGGFLSAYEQMVSRLGRSHGQFFRKHLYFEEK